MATHRLCALTPVPSMEVEPKSTRTVPSFMAAITKANESVDESIRMTPMQIQRIAESVEFSCLKMNRSPSVEEIQDLVEYQIMAHGALRWPKTM